MTETKRNENAGTQSAGTEQNPADKEAAAPRRFEDLPPAAQRALREAEARREAVDARARSRPREINGRGGLDPVRYDDWEIKGLTVDF